MGAKQKGDLMEQPIPNPVLNDLEALPGEWSLEIDFPSDPPIAVRRHVSFEWIEGGAFLVMGAGVEWEGPSGSVAVIGRDEALETYAMLYFDARGVSWIYQMSFGEGVWNQWWSAPGFSQRFTGTFSEDDNTIVARWEKSTDGSRWEHDFDLTYTRAT